eukprot:TRINITY_DN5047_c0_g1_i1.p1 TRINITY_DN5047_c0_g1~~TRINITY_DN5047_c0_g1_i1.p1  ORF type:complete len:554 (-),score=122.31 TRINITY_DN5047_c0_g1_i1:161-1597(-)
MSDRPPPHPESTQRVNYRHHPYRTPNTPFTLSKANQQQNKSNTAEQHTTHDSLTTQALDDQPSEKKQSDSSAALNKNRNYPLSKFSPTERDDPSNFNLPPLQHIYAQPPSPNSPTLTPIKMPSPSPSHPYNYYNPLNSPVDSASNSNRLSLSSLSSSNSHIHHNTSTSLFPNPPSVKEPLPSNLASPYYNSPLNTPMYSLPPREPMFRESREHHNFNAPPYNPSPYYPNPYNYHPYSQSQSQSPSLPYPLREPSMKLKDILSEDPQVNQGPVFPPASAFTNTPSPYYSSTTSTSSSSHPIHTQQRSLSNSMNSIVKKQPNDINENFNTLSQPATQPSSSAPKSNPKVYKFHPNPLCFPQKTKEDKPPWTEQGLSEFLESQVVKGSKVLLKLGSDIMTLTQEEAAAKLGISPTRLCRKWSQTMGPRKWPYRAHVKVEREIAQLKAGYQDQEQMPDHVKERLDSLEELKKKILEPAFILV